MGNKRCVKGHPWKLYWYFLQRENNQKYQEYNNKTQNIFTTEYHIAMKRSAGYT